MQRQPKSVVAATFREHNTINLRSSDYLLNSQKPRLPEIPNQTIELNLLDKKYKKSSSQLSMNASRQSIFFQTSIPRHDSLSL